MPTYTINPIFYAAGYLSGLTAMALTVAAFVGIFLCPMPVGYARALRVMAFILLATSTVISVGYAWEWYSFFRSDNVYENYVFLRTRGAGPVTDLIHLINPAFPRLPWDPYWWTYYLLAAAGFCPQLFWIPIFRRRPLLVFSVASAVLISIWFEWLIISLTRFFNPDFLPSSWS